MKPEEIIAISTMIATLLTEGKSLQEIATIKNIINQINCSIHSIYAQKLISGPKC